MTKQVLEKAFNRNILIDRNGYASLEDRKDIYICVDGCHFFAELDLSFMFHYTQCFNTGKMGKGVRIKIEKL
jgi:hypothetical protein